IKVNEGEFVAITGVSGSGKSTLLNLCTGLDEPTSGEVFVMNKEITRMETNKLVKFRGKNMGIVFQTPNLIPHYTLYENVVLPLAANDRQEYNHEERLQLLFDTLSLNDRLHHLPSELSGGQQQRCAIARALVNYPQILFADEPTGNLDKGNASEVLKLLFNLKETIGLTLMIVTHDMGIAAQADCIMKMDNGEIITITREEL
ncbi:MAG: ABC transporter ATP-binding protein, partial [Oscillospiraceae bacterium]|nr:ABC transporter ATP-binding protein [Oscillospiraceae bacterium]